MQTVPSQPETTVPSNSALHRIRVYAFYAVVLLTLALGVLFTGELLLLLALGWTAGAGAELGIHRLHLMGIATTVLVFLVGMAVQLYKPRQRRAAMLAATGFIIILGGAVVLTAPTEVVQEVVPFIVLGVVAAILHPSGRRLLAREDEFSPLLLGLTVVAAIPLLAFAANQITLQGTGDAHAVAGHYSSMAALALGAILLGAIASARTPGWRIVTWLTGLLVGYFGVLSVAFPAQASSVGMMWGAAAIIWALAFIGAAEYSRGSASSSLFHREWRTGRET